MAEMYNLSWCYAVCMYAIDRVNGRIYASMTSGWWLYQKGLVLFLFSVNAPITDWNKTQVSMYELSKQMKIEIFDGKKRFQKDSLRQAFKEQDLVEK